MPNWTQNTIIGSKGLVTQFLTKDKESGDYFFDFNKLIPMPEELNITSGSSEDDAVVAYYLSLDEQQQKALKKELSLKGNDYYKNYSNKYLNEHNVELVQNRNPDGFSEEQVSMGAKYISNIRKYGHPQWYDWCCNNWGTKWNASGTYVENEDGDGNVTVTFNTAWSAPMKVIEKFAEYCKDGELHWEFEDDDPDPFMTHILEKVNGKIAETLENDEENMEDEGILDDSDSSSTNASALESLFQKGNFGLDEDKFLEVYDYLDHLRDIMWDIETLANKVEGNGAAYSVSSWAEENRSKLDDALGSLIDVGIKEWIEAEEAEAEGGTR